MTDELMSEIKAPKTDGSIIMVVKGFLFKHLFQGRCCALHHSGCCLCGFVGVCYAAYGAPCGATDPKTQK